MNNVNLIGRLTKDVELRNTFNSTGTPALFMHAADAIHGDLGMVCQDDIVICLSNSGETPEVKVLAPLICMGGHPLVALTGNPDSFLAKNADFVLCTQITREACPLNLAPTASTTAQLAMGDALAVCVLELRNFSPNDFARFHPGGNLGKRLYLRVADICALNLTPNVLPTAPLHEVLLAISAGRLGAVAVCLPQPTQLVVIGIITDGDLRRAMLNKGQNWLSLTASDVMSHKPVTVLNTDLAINAHELIRQHKISQVVALNEQGYYAGMVHIHDLVREGIV